MKLKNIIKTFKGIQVPRDRTSIVNEVPYLHYGDIYKLYDTQIDIDKVYDEIIKISTDEKIKDFQYLNNNDIVMNLTSENYEDLGKSVLIVNKNNIPFVGGMETHIFKIVDKNVLPAYLQYYFQSDLFSRTLIQYTYGMKVFRANPKHFGEIEVDVPNLSKQQHIVDIGGNLWKL